MDKFEECFSGWETPPKIEALPKVEAPPKFEEESLWRGRTNPLKASSISTNEL